MDHSAWPAHDWRVGARLANFPSFRDWKCFASSPPVPNMPRTRSAAPAAPAASTTDKKKELTSVDNPSKTFILPASTSSDARLLSLPNPQSGEPSRYFFCPEKGLFEFTVVATPPHAARSILFTPTAQLDSETQLSAAKASIAKKADLLVATPIDPIFFLIPLLAPSSKSGQSLFQPLDDIIDSNDDLSSHFRHVLYNDKFRSTLISRAESICNTVEAGDEVMLRFDEGKLLQELVGKAQRMATAGLPASLEERFIRQALAAPLMAVKREDVLTGQAPKSEEPAVSEEKADSPSTVATTATPSVSTPAGESTPVPLSLGEESGAADNVSRLLRISTALAYLKEAYLSQALATRLDELLAAPESPVNFQPLTDRLKELAEMRAEALASRKMSDFTRKRGLDDEEVEARAEKKRKKDEEDKKAKLSESRGVKDLKKVNTTGMKKMSDFFKKKP